MGDIIKSIKAFLYDRTVSPLFGAFVVAWAICNYRVIVALLDDKATFHEKMVFIDDYYGVIEYQIAGHGFHLWGVIVHGFLAPTLLTLIYLFIYPWLAKPVYEHSLSKQKELRDIKQKAENIRLLTVEESRNLIKEIEQLRYSADEDAKKYSERIASLTETINSYEAGGVSGHIIDPEKSYTQIDGAMLRLQDFEMLVKSRVDTLPDGEFELSGLLAQDGWAQLEESTKSKYGKLFKAMVERGELESVTLSRKGSGNQLIYQKTSGILITNAATFRDAFTKKYKLVDTLPKEERDDLLNKISQYVTKNNISMEMFSVLMLLVFAGDPVNRSALKQKLSNEMNSIESDHAITKLRDSGLVSIDSYHDRISLADKGNAMAVESGLAKLARLSTSKKPPK